MLRNILVAAVLVIVTAARVSAAPIPLLEMKWQQVDNENGPVPAAVEFNFAGGDTINLSYSFVWIAEHGLSDVGVSFWAPSDVVEGANTALSDPDAGYELVNGPFNPSGTFNLYDDAQDPSSEPPCPQPVQCAGVAFYVDDFPSYTVTAVERVINYLVLTETEPYEPPFQFGEWLLESSQTIRYWGVPEPGSVVLLSLGVAYLSLSCRPRPHRPS
jgi:hypothetical protein